MSEFLNSINNGLLSIGHALGNYYQFIVVVVAAIAAILFFVYIRRVYAVWEEKRRARANEIRFVKSRKDIRPLFMQKDTKRKRDKDAETDRFLMSSGFYYMTNNKLGLAEYYAIQWLCALLGFILGAVFSIWIAPVAAVVGYFIPRLALRASNESDNTKMLESIKDVYDIVRVQTRNNVHLTNALFECYLVCRNPRLKRALYELVTDIRGKGDEETAMDIFSSKFDNAYVESLAVSLRQAMDTGQTERIFADVAKQIEAIDEAILIREEGRATRTNTGVQAAVYISILAAIFYFVFIAVADIYTLL